ncbi:MULTISPECIES: ABC transporter permease [unclassified Chelatococcus]|uniref:ABC transporter permease n=1 Tax=unclassified Chelatococcus TaxID=2638111 RepID=UPI001BCEDB09|nr:MULTISPECIES: ABC transporter permease [unclassified Chelatococcus]CAH1671204.1 putative spermidine/putrescine transport system permease protein [Hyphomicrobiales bacterium]MBS7739106.1 ABC transporter permease [Chelatococcus sp. HY11]MBX3543541.1 ABC transporter permease [Chelatococcus sp.]MCO5076364.1 ABC transporter permease [Chelatococcus sp.]CAH1676601.1 putative spermidine/putrescine transport system permease protein [Hyphomicrobiales bacterium]
MVSVRKFFREASFAAPATLFLGLIFAVPLVGIVLMSLQKSNNGGDFTIAAYNKIVTTPLFLRVVYTTLEISVGATFCALLLAYPVAYFLATQPPRRRALFMIFVLIPFWTSSLVKAFSFMVLLGQTGIVNQMLELVGIPPVKLLFNRIGVFAGMSHYLVPFFVFPILASLQSQPPELARAAAIMGAGKLRIFLRVTLPLSMPGVIAGALLVFTISLSFYVIPALLGGRKDMMIANLVDFYAREVLDWPMASAVAVVLIGVAVAASVALSKVRGGGSMLEGRSH